MQAQLERWASLHPTLARTGRMSEVPPSWLVPRIVATLGLTGLLWWGNSAIFWNQKVNPGGFRSFVATLPHPQKITLPVLLCTARHV
jgi:hypothetical protein